MVWVATDRLLVTKVADPPPLGIVPMPSKLAGAIEPS